MSGIDQGSSHAHQPHVTSQSKWALPLAALGVVYGDIGTSPLYALRECFHGPHGIVINETSVFGVLSLVFWVLLLVISIKYMVFVLRADNRGEGGILALTALAVPRKIAEKSFILFALGIFGAALLYGDGILTPALTVLSAIEGLTVATPMFEKFVVPISCTILVALFSFQRHGTARIGAIFGPLMLVWFTVLGVLGLSQIVEHPHVLRAINPIYALDFIIHHKIDSFYVMGSLFLVVTGGEALYADMGHFGRSPIRTAWFYTVLPGLLLNYFGQGALLLSNPSSAQNPFFMMAPSWSLYPLVALATAASVIASQALISGVFSLTRQAIQLGLCPRLKIVHTSSHEIGQIYLPHMNWALLLGCLWLVVEFKSSSNLAAAYGISVSATMVITTILLAVVERKLWGWSLSATALSSIVFISIDAVFFGANIIKIEQGGYIPLAIGACIYTLMNTWRKGRMLLAEKLRKSVVSLHGFFEDLPARKVARVPGTAIFMVGDTTITPPALIHNLQHNKVLHECVIILTVKSKEIPIVSPSDRLRIEKLPHGFFQVVAAYGFAETPDVMEIVSSLPAKGLQFDTKEITYFLGRETLVATAHPGMAIWREHIFVFMSRNAQRPTAFFNIPADQVVEIGLQIEL